MASEAKVDISTCPAVLFVFSQEECPACVEYLPRLYAALEASKYPFSIYEGDGKVAAKTIPVLVYDVASTDPGLQQLADRFAISSTPTTVAALRGPGTMNVPGNLSDSQITYLLTVLGEAAKRA